MLTTTAVPATGRPGMGSAGRTAFGRHDPDCVDAALVLYARDLAQAVAGHSSMLTGRATMA